MTMNLPTALTTEEPASPIHHGRLIHNDFRTCAPVSPTSVTTSCSLLHDPAEVSSGGESDSEQHQQQHLSSKENISRGGVVTPFPYKLHDMLERVQLDGVEHIVEWMPHGRAFQVHRPVEFVAQVMPIYFNQTKFASFQRQLNLYGFRRLTQGKDKGAYFHECFLRGRRSLCQGMSRQKVKGTKVRRAITSAQEPDFYKMAPLPPSRPTTTSSGTAYPSLKMRESKQGREQEEEEPEPLLFSQRNSKTGDLLFFEGKPFHYLDSNAAAAATPPLVPSIDIDATSSKQEHSVLSVAPDVVPSIVSL